MPGCTGPHVFIGRDGVTEPSLLTEYCPEVVVRLGEVRLKCDPAPICCLSLTKLTECLQRISQIDTGCRKGRLDPERLAD